MPLGTAGALAGVGDLVQARRNDRTLIGFEGNTTFPVNRKTYRVHATRADGGLTVRRVLGRVEGVEQLDPRILHLPPEYVTEKVRLAYASTVHAALGPHRRHRPRDHRPGDERQQRLRGHHPGSGTQHHLGPHPERPRRGGAGAGQQGTRPDRPGCPRRPPRSRGSREIRARAKGTSRARGPLSADPRG